jgi:hypothetical protein
MNVNQVSRISFSRFNHTIFPDSFSGSCDTDQNILRPLCDNYDKLIKT